MLKLPKFCSSLLLNAHPLEAHVTWLNILEHNQLFSPTTTYPPSTNLATQLLNLLTSENLVLPMSKHHPPYPQFALYHVITNNCTITKISISSIHALIITYSPSRLLPLAPSFHQLSDTPKHFQAIDFVKFSLLVVASLLDSLAPVVLSYNILFPFSNPS